MIAVAGSVRGFICVSRPLTAASVHTEPGTAPDSTGSRCCSDAAPENQRITPRRPPGSIPNYDVAMVVDAARALGDVPRAAPTLADARRAADALAHLDPGLVLLYGSVAEDTADADSDLDLVVVFDDLGDYGERSLLRRRAMEAVEGAIGRHVDVRVTDRPEWRRRTACVSSFERHVESCAVTLRERRAGDVDWHKEIPITPTDAGMAEASLDAVAQALVSLNNELTPYVHELEASKSGDVEWEERSRARRMRRLCATAQTTMETALKALNHALPGPHPPRTHDLATLIELLPTKANERDVLKAAIRGLDLGEAAQWREMGTYPGDFPAERSTLEHATRMVNAAARLTLAVVDLVEDRLGESEPSREVRSELHRLAGRAAPTPIPDDEPLPGAGRTSQTLPELTAEDMTRQPH